MRKFRPKLNIALDRFDWMVEIIGAVFLILMIGFPLYYFRELPDIIPMHLNAAGDVDGYSQKGSIWILPAFGSVMYIGMFILSKYPHVFNYPREITEKNAERQYRIAAKLVRTLNMLVAVAFFYIEYGIISTSLNRLTGLGSFFIPTLLVLVFGSVGIYMYQAFRNN